MNLPISCRLIRVYPRPINLSGGAREPPLHTVQHCLSKISFRRVKFVALPVQPSRSPRPRSGRGVKRMMRRRDHVRILFPFQENPSLSSCIPSFSRPRIRALFISRIPYSYVSIVTVAAGTARIILVPKPA